MHYLSHWLLIWKKDEGGGGGGELVKGSGIGKKKLKGGCERRGRTASVGTKERENWEESKDV